MAYLKLILNIEESIGNGVSLSDSNRAKAFMDDIRPYIEKHGLTIQEEHIIGPYYPPDEWLEMYTPQAREALIRQIQHLDAEPEGHDPEKKLFDRIKAGLGW